MNAADMDPKELGAALMRTGLRHSVRAGLDLIIHHTQWLTRPEFLALVEVEEMAGGTITYAWLDDDQAAALADTADAGARDIALLRLAMHLTGHVPANTQEWTLRAILDELAGEDPEPSAAAAMKAIAWAVTGSRV